MSPYVTFIAIKAIFLFLHVCIATSVRRLIRSLVEGVGRSGGIRLGVVDVSIVIGDGGVIVQPNRLKGGGEV